MYLPSNSTLQSGKYRIIRVLGQGGFGITYLAENTFFDKLVAIKEFFPKDFCGRDNTSHLTLGTQNNAETVEKLKARFLKEAKNIAKLDHPGIIKIHDIFEENNTAYYVMDFIEGENLNEMVKRQGPLSEDKAVKYIRKVGDALDYIHSRNMTHFDVKPANIMVRRSNDQPILIDFGLSKQYDAHGDATSTLMQGISHGYSPIELYNAGAITSFSPQTDVYSLGATLYYLLTGTVPPSASQIIEDGLQFPKGVSPNICFAIEQAMSANRTKRYKTINYFCSALSEDINSETDKTSEKMISPTKETQTEETELVEREDKSQPSAQIHQVSEKVCMEGSDCYSEEEPSRWNKFVNWICGTRNLVNANQIPNSKKVAYLLLLTTLFVAASMFPIAGWLFIVVVYKYIRNSLQRLFFADYLDEMDDAYDYSKGKAITIITLVMCIPISLGLLVFSITRSDKKKDVTEYVTGRSAGCPYNIFDVQVSSFSYVDGDIIVTLHSTDSIHTNPNRDYLNKLNINLWKPSFIDEALPHYNVLKNNDIIFKFYNNGREMKSITITPKELEEYKSLSEQSRSNEILTSYMALENAYFPCDLGASVKLTNVSIDRIDNNEGDYLTYVFVDNDRIMEQEFGDSLNYKISQFLPLNMPYLAESVANSIHGIGYKINNSNGVVAEDVLYTSSDLKRLLKQK